MGMVPAFDKASSLSLMKFSCPCLLCFCAALSAVRSVHVKMGLKYFILVHVSSDFEVLVYSKDVFRKSK